MTEQKPKNWQVFPGGDTKDVCFHICKALVVQRCSLKSSSKWWALFT